VVAIPKLTVGLILTRSNYVSLLSKYTPRSQKILLQYDAGGGPGTIREILGFEEGWATKSCDWQITSFLSGPLYLGKQVLNGEAQIQCHLRITQLYTPRLWPGFRQQRNMNSSWKRGIKRFDWWTEGRFDALTIVERSWSLKRALRGRWYLVRVSIERLQSAMAVHENEKMCRIITLFFWVLAKNEHRNSFFPLKSRPLLQLYHPCSFETFMQVFDFQVSTSITRFRESLKPLWAQNA